MSTQQIIESWENGVEPYNATTHRRNRYIEREVKRQLGSAYSYEDELYYFGNPLSDHWQTPSERKTLASIERSWTEATTDIYDRFPTS